MTEIRKNVGKAQTKFLCPHCLTKVSGAGVMGTEYTQYERYLCKECLSILTFVALSSHPHEPKVHYGILTFPN